MARGNNRQRIFFNDEDFHYLFNIIEESTKKFDHTILAYCFMTNHFHIVIYVRKFSLSEIMQYINYRYVRKFNKKYARIGHLFQGRYKSLEVCDEIYLINLCRYIHLNPVVANIVRTPIKYIWSSHHYYVSLEAPTWLDFKIVLAAIKNKTSLNYSEFINQAPERKKWKPTLYLSETGEIVIDNNIQKERVEKNLTVINLSLSQQCIEKVVCAHLAIAPSKLYGASRNREISKKRALLINYYLKYSDMNLGEVAKLFHRTSGTLSRQVGAFHFNWNEYFPRALLKKIEMNLECDS